MFEPVPDSHRFEPRLVLLGLALAGLLGLRSRGRTAMGREGTLLAIAAFVPVLLGSFRAGLSWLALAPLAWFAGDALVAGFFRVRAALLKPNAKAVESAGFVAKDVRSMQPTVAKEYDYVATLGYFTPRVLDGVRIVSAEEVQALMGKGAVLYDTRSEEEYRDKHIKGAKWLPYREKSAKEVGFDFTKDAFDVARAGGKDAPVIFACNGAECWKSYKSCVAARKEGFTQVYWFRGGFPEWVARGYPVESVPANVAIGR